VRQAIATRRAAAPEREDAERADGNGSCERLRGVDTQRDQRCGCRAGAQEEERKRNRKSRARDRPKAGRLPSQTLRPPGRSSLLATFAPPIWPRTDLPRPSTSTGISPRLAPSPCHPPIPRPALPLTKARLRRARSPQPHPGLCTPALSPSRPPRTLARARFCRTHTPRPSVASGNECRMDRVCGLARPWSARPAHSLVDDNGRGCFGWCGCHGLLLSETGLVSVGARLRLATGE
jgi:hypothetical protein